MKHLMTAKLFLLAASFLPSQQVDMEVEVTLALERARQPVEVAPAAKVKSCHCSERCTCGCNLGEPCDCAALKQSSVTSSIRPLVKFSAPRAAANCVQ
jgi:hypothetical protein